MVDMSRPRNIIQYLKDTDDVEYQTIMKTNDVNENFIVRVAKKTSFMFSKIEHIANGYYSHVTFSRK